MKNFNDYPILATHRDRLGVERLVHAPGHRGPDLRCHWSNSGANETKTTSSATQLTGQTSGDNSPSVTGGGTINVTDGGAISSMATVANNVINSASNQGELIFKLVDNALQTSQSSSTQTVAAMQTLLGQQLSAQSALASNVQSGGQTEQNKTILYALAIGAALVGLIMWRRA